MGSWSNLTNGPFGIPGIPKPRILGLALIDSVHFFLLATAMAAPSAPSSSTA